MSLPGGISQRKMLNVTNAAMKEFIPSVLNLGGTYPPCPLQSQKRRVFLAFLEWFSATATRLMPGLFAHTLHMLSLPCVLTIL